MHVLSLRNTKGKLIVMLTIIRNLIRLLPKYRKEPYLSLHSILGFTPKTISLYTEAVTHKSYTSRIHKSKQCNNERLEFLGDTILDAIIADLLYKRYPNYNEGVLTTLKSRIVQRETLNKLALKLELNQIVKVELSCNNIEHTHVFGSALEALIGAIYLDKGFEVAYKFVAEKLINKYINLDEIAKTNDNYKSRLIEWGQKNKVDVNFELISSEIDENNNTNFCCQVIINGKEICSGNGLSKKESHQDAAKKTIELLKSNPILCNDLLSEQNDQLEE